MFIDNIFVCLSVPKSNKLKAQEFILNKPITKIDIFR